MSKIFVSHSVRCAVLAGLLFGFFSSTPAWAMNKKQVAKLQDKQELEKEGDNIDKAKNSEISSLSSFLLMQPQKSLDTMKKALELVEKQKLAEKKNQEKADKKKVDNIKKALKLAEKQNQEKEDKKKIVNLDKQISELVQKKDKLVKKQQENSLKTKPVGMIRRRRKQVQKENNNMENYRYTQKNS